MIAADKPHAPRRQESPDEQAAPSRRERREIASKDLFGANREVHIRHADEIYTLRQTNKGKLILTK